MNKLIIVLVVLVGFMYLKSQHIVEGFGMGAQAQMASNQGDTTLYGNGGQNAMASNGLLGGIFDGQNENITPTSNDQYQMMMQGQGRGSTGSPNFAGHRPVRPIHPPEFTPDIQRALMMRERQHASQRYNRYRGYHITGIDLVDNVLSKILMLLQQIFELIIGVLNALLGWAF